MNSSSFTPLSHNVENDNVNTFIGISENTINRQMSINAGPHHTHTLTPTISVSSSPSKSIALSQTMIYSLNTQQDTSNPISTSSNDLLLDRLSNEVSINNNNDALTPLFRFHRNATATSSFFSSSSSSPLSSSSSSSTSNTFDQLLTTIKNITDNVQQNVTNLGLDSRLEESESFLNSLTTNSPQFQLNLTVNSTLINSTDSSVLDYEDDVWNNQNLCFLFAILTGFFVLILVLVILLCHFCDAFRRCRPHSSDDASYCERDHSSRSSLTSSEHHHHSSKHHHASTLYINNPNSLDISCNATSACVTSSAAITRSLSVPGQQQLIYGSQLSKNIVNYYESQQQNQQQTTVSASSSAGKHVEPLSNNNSIKNNKINCNNETTSLDVIGQKSDIFKKSFKGGVLLNDFILAPPDDHSTFGTWTSGDFRSASFLSSANDYSTLQRINFTKTRRNRMRNDSAAAIALIKSGVFMHSNNRTKVNDTGDNKTNICNPNEIIFDTWDTIPEVAFGGSSAVPVCSTHLNTPNVSIVNCNNKQQRIAVNSNAQNVNNIIDTSNSSVTPPQLHDLSPSESDEAIVVYNERTAL